MGAAKPDVRLDHVALLPANLLLLQDHWQPVLEGLPEGEVLVVLPAGDGALRSLFELVALVLATMGHYVTPLEADHVVPMAAGGRGVPAGGTWMSDGSEEKEQEQEGGLWEQCQLEREEQTGFFGSTVVYTAVTTDRSGHRRVVATERVQVQPGSTGGWEVLAERLGAGGWEQLPHAADALPAFRRRRR